jgi:hypothetical protein
MLMRIPSDRFSSYCIILCVFFTWWWSYWSRLKTCTIFKVTKFYKRTYRTWDVVTSSVWYTWYTSVNALTDYQCSPILGSYWINAVSSHIFAPRFFFPLGSKLSRSFETQHTLTLKPSNLQSGGARFESGPEHRLFRWMFLVVFVSPCKQFWSTA